MYLVGKLCLGGTGGRLLNGGPCPPLQSPLRAAPAQTVMMEIQK